MKFLIAQLSLVACAFLCLPSMAMVDEISMKRMPNTKNVQIFQNEKAGFGQKIERMQTATTNLLTYSDNEGVKNLIIPNFGMFGEIFFDLVSAQFLAYLKDNPQSQLKICVVVYENKLAQTFKAKNQTLLEKNPQLKDKIFVCLGNLKEIIYTLQKRNLQYSRSHAVFTPAHGSLFDVVQATVKNLDVPFLYELKDIDSLFSVDKESTQEKVVGSIDAPSPLGVFSELLAPSHALQLRDWPKAEHYRDGIKFSDLHKASKGSRKVLGTICADGKNECFVRFSKLMDVMEAIDYPKQLGGKPAALYLALSNSALNLQEQYRALDALISRSESETPQYGFDIDRITYKKYTNPSFNLVTGFSFDTNVIEMWADYMLVDPILNSPMCRNDLAENITLKAVMKIVNESKTGAANDLDKLLGELSVTLEIISKMTDSRNFQISLYLSDSKRALDSFQSSTTLENQASYFAITTRVQEQIDRLDMLWQVNYAPGAPRFTKNVDNE